MLITLACQFRSYWRALAVSETNRKYTYYAFISYKHGDMKWGRWLQRSLEHYRLPSALCRQLDLPRRLTPIFRDETDLGAGKSVHDNLLDKLRQSKYLIVICSRKMQHRPEYIDYEIQQFLALGNPRSHILPVVVDGEGVAADPANEAMPPSLLAMGDQRPLGITMDHRRKKDVIIKLAASMLGLELESLRSHDQQRRQRRIVTALSLGLCAALGLGALMAWEFLSVKRAQLREQLTYSQSAYQSGDRYQAVAMAEEVLAENPLILTDEIKQQARRIRTAAAITPVTGSLTTLERVSSDSRIIPCADGASFFIMGDNQATRYNLQGEATLTFSASSAGSKLHAVSPDGRHALVTAFPTAEMPATTLWLWDMEENRQLACLTGNNHFDMSNMTAGNFDNVVQGAFSPDGSLVCAYAKGGYFTENQTLWVFSSETGEPVVGIPAELLITGPGNSNATPTVEDFSFISDTLLHWQGPKNHVYYDMTTGEASIVSVYASTRAQEKDAVLHDRYVVLAADGILQVVDLATDRRLTLDAPEALAVAANAITTFGPYAAIPTLAIAAETAVLQDLTVVDLSTMTVSLRLSEAYPDACGKYAAMNTFVMQESGRIYASMAQGVKTGVGRIKKAAEDVFLCLDVPRGAVSRVTNLSTVWLQEGVIGLGSLGDADWLITNDNGQARLLCVTSQTRFDLPDSLRTTETFLLDTLYADAAQNFTLAGTQEQPRLISIRNNQYFLNTLETPGVQLDATLDMDTERTGFTAASADGRTLLKAQGQTAALWQDGALHWTLPLENNAVSACLSRDGRLALVSTYRSLFILDAASGSVLHRYDAGEDNSIQHAKLSGDGKLMLLAIAPISGLRDKQMQLLALPADGSRPPLTLTEEAYYPPSDESGHVFDLTDDGRFAAVIEYLSVGGKYQRAVSVYNPLTGALLARTPVVGLTPSCAELDVSGYYSSSVAYDFLRFGDDRTLMAGLYNGVWLFDMEKLATHCFIPDGSQIEGLPLLRNGNEVLYPAGGLHAWSADALTLLGTVSTDTMVNARLNSNAAFAAGELHLSADGSLVTITGVNSTLLVDASTWQVLGNAASSAVHVVYLDHSRLVYDTGTGLYELLY